MIGFGQNDTSITYKYIIISEINTTTYRTGAFRDMWDKPARRQLKKYLEKIQFNVLDPNEAFPEDLQSKEAHALYCYLNLVERSFSSPHEVIISLRSDQNDIVFLDEGIGITPKIAIKDALEVLLKKGKFFILESGEYTIPKIDYNKLTIAKIDSCIEGDCINGYGVFHLENGDIYNGMFKRGKRHGKGIYTFADGDIYDGEWEKDFQHGTGIQTIDGDSMKGEFHRGELSFAADLIGNQSFSLSGEQNKFPDYIVLNIDSSSINDSYNRTLNWVSKPSFDNEKKIISQQENKSIQIQGINKIDINGQKFDVRYFIQFRFKTNRIKFEVLDAEIYFSDQIESKINWKGFFWSAAVSSLSEGSVSYITPVTKDEYLPGEWVKLSFTHSELVKSNDIDEQNIIVQIINSFTIMARDLAHHLNTPIEQVDDW